MSNFPTKCEKTSMNFGNGGPRMPKGGGGWALVTIGPRPLGYASVYDLRTYCFSINLPPALIIYQRKRCTASRALQRASWSNFPTQL